MLKRKKKRTTRTDRWHAGHFHPLLDSIDVRLSVLNVMNLTLSFKRIRFSDIRVTVAAGTFILCVSHGAFHIFLILQIYSLLSFFLSDILQNRRDFQSTSSGSRTSYQTNCNSGDESGTTSGSGCGRRRSVRMF